MPKSYSVMPEYPAQIPKLLGHALAEYRRAAGLTQRVAGARVRLSQAKVSALEKDPTAASVRTIYRLLAAVDAEIVVRRRFPIDAVDPMVALANSAPAAPYFSRRRLTKKFSAARNTLKANSASVLP